MNTVRSLNPHGLDFTFDGIRVKETRKDAILVVPWNVSESELRDAITIFHVDVGREPDLIVINTHV